MLTNTSKLGFSCTAPFPAARCSDPCPLLMQPHFFLKVKSTICLSLERKEILSGMLHSNTIGFQTFSYARHLSSSCARILDLECTPKSVCFEKANVMLEIVPIGIDTENLFDPPKKNPKAIEQQESIARLYHGKKIIFGKDTLDIVSGIMQKLVAFDQFLSMYPEWKMRVVLIQVIASYSSNYPSLESKVAEKVSQINAKHGSIEFSPIVLYRPPPPSSLPTSPQSSLGDEEELFSALMKMSDLGLVTVIRDGMNTTALEYISCQKEKKSPLILSEFAGAASSISGAIQINPWNTYDVAHQI
ncbi:Alpha,alpha-trehalose-phosphate synthase [UDP-forming], partial [Smittium mucronatum]